jgi:hypothetical protein
MMQTSTDRARRKVKGKKAGTSREERSISNPKKLGDVGPLVVYHN